MKIIKRPSPNYTPKKYRRIKYIIIHYTGMKSSQLSLKRLRDKRSKVSCHYFINDKGSLLQLVDDKNIAWHAGISYWNKEKLLNKNSLGIEIQNKGELLGYTKFNKDQIKILINLIINLKSKYNINNYNILGHSDIAPDRKTDPGYLFPWIHLKKNGIGLLPSKKYGKKELIKNNEIQILQKLLNKFGYKIKITGNMDLQTMLVLNAFQSHFLQDRVKYFLYDSSLIIVLKDLISQKNRCLTKKT